MRKSALSIAVLAAAAVAVFFWTRSPQVESPPIEKSPPKSAPAVVPVPVREPEPAPVAEPTPPPKSQTKVAANPVPTAPAPCAALAMRQNAKWREATLERSRVNYAMQMPDLATDLQIPQAQADKVFAILARQSLSFEDVREAATVNDGASWADLKKRQDETRRAADAELAQVLGSAKAADFRQYQQNAPVRAQVDRLQASLAGTPAELRPEQIGQLTDALTANLAQAHEAAASAALSPAQLARFDELRKLELEQRAAVSVSLEALWKTSRSSTPAVSVPVEVPPQNMPFGCARPQRPSPNAVADTRKLFSDPNYRAVVLKEDRANVAIEMIDQAKVLHLSQSEAGKLADMLAEQRVRQQEAIPPMGSAERRRAFDELRRTFDDEREKLLGPEKFEEWKKYRDSRRARTEVYTLRSQLAASAQPLRDDQVEPLIDSIDQELKRLDEESSPSSNDSAATPFSSVPAERDALAIQQELDRFKAAIERMHDAAALLLMPEQLARWDRMMQLELAQETARDRIESVQTDLLKQTATTKL